MPRNNSSDLLGFLVRGEVSESQALVARRVVGDSHGQRRSAHLFLEELHEVALGDALHAPDRDCAALRRSQQHQRRRKHNGSCWNQKTKQGKRKADNKARLVTPLMGARYLNLKTPLGHALSSVFLSNVDLHS